MKRKIFYLLPFIILAVGFGVMQLLSGQKEPPEKKKPEPTVKIVETSTVELTDVSAEIIAHGRLISSRPVVLNSEVAGTLERGNLPFRPGQAFNKGDLLVKVDTRQITLDINTAKSDLLTALARVLPEIKVDFPDEYTVWENYFNNCDFEKPLPVLPRAANQKIKLYLSRFNVYKIYYTIRDLEILYEKHFFFAPFRGSIIEADLRVGSNVRNGTRLGKIISLESLEAEMQVSAEDIQWIDENRPVILTSSEILGSWTGRIRRIGKTIDTRTQTVQVYIAVDATDDTVLYDGVFLKAVIPGRIIPRAIVVPNKALYEQKYVYILEEGRLASRFVTIARRNADQAIINGGLEEGDQLVTSMLQGVATGMLARSKNEAVGGDEL